MYDAFSTAFYEYVRTSSSSSSASLPTTDLSARPFVASPLIANASSPRPTPPFGGLPWRLFRIQFLNEQYEYLMTAPTTEHVCYQKQLFVSAHVRPNGIEHRDAIRGTWAAEMPDAVILRFFVCGTDVYEQQHLFEENRRHGDMVFCDLPDDYFQLHLKIHAIMQWQQTYCPLAQFWLKADDDVAVHLPRLLYWINEDFRKNLASNPKVIFGVFGSGRVRRDKKDKWFVPYEVYAYRYFPPYSTGASYVVTSAAVRAILNGTSTTNGLHVEDALYTGVIASNVGVQKFSRRRLFHEDEM
ncbi:lactosylceramide 1,3-N-acetyl-beta-D-glucosaminyltransferase A-like isoform X1, partial [Aphelenchoides avenae]